ncbi:sigma 54-interacting transcriptional regulator [Orbus sasakiae]|uniref:Sigma 54-interacting transcriptional regulator n=1 Tax=Orbus sasakiae TaxID=1078475 RepID=A0ABP9N2X1_9GAMM
MKLANIMKPQLDNLTLNHHDAVLDVSMNVEDIDAKQLKNMPNLIYVNDSKNKIVGSVNKSTLEYVSSKIHLLPPYALMDYFNEAIIFVDEQGKIYFANSAYSKILGVPLGKIIGKTIYEVEPHAALIDVLQYKTPFYKEKQYIKTVDKYVSVKINPIFEKDIFIGAYSIFSDVSEVNRLSEEVNRITQLAEDYSTQINAQNELKKLKIIGNSPEFVKVIKQSLTVAKTDVSVLLRGENGVGKEVIAKLIYEHSQRSDKPFITVNCSAIPEQLIESELFGYEDGAFTGAAKGGSMGKFQLADGGTIFLDEIGDMPFFMQSKLLRVLQEGEIEKIGRKKNIPVNVRVIAATNQPLEIMIHNKQFREDLYYRLNVVSLKLPALRERREDIMLLTNFFLKKFNKKYHKNATIAHSVFKYLYQYDWPGNIRELQNSIERAVIFSTDGMVNEESILFNQPSYPVADTVDVPVVELKDDHIVPALDEAVKALEIQLIKQSLTQHDNDKDAAANQLNISKRTFYRKLKAYQLC